MGEISTAIGLLRRALQLSPRDPDISALLGKLAFRDRQVGPG
jgi:cytochrome c-type biogenesis protein CcmH/NrfG